MQNVYNVMSLSFLLPEWHIRSGDALESNNQVCFSSTYEELIHENPFMVTKIKKIKSSSEIM